MPPLGKYKTDMGRENNYCIIMAGGVGSRFWPVSRNDKPKQFLDFFGTGISFLQQTYNRFAKIIPAENILVVTSDQYEELVKEQLPQMLEENILLEPHRRNTAPCIAYASYYLRHKNQDAEMIVTPSDHLILNEVEFSKVVESSLEFITHNPALMTIGIEPTRPETGYGYIQRSSAEAICKVKCFTEKPIRELAEAFLECGEFLWNSGIFIWKVKDIIAAFEQHLPDHAAQFSAVEQSFGTAEEQKAIEKVFSECRSISIDYGIMERSSNVWVRCSDFGWSDLGTWGSLHVNSKKDAHNNALIGENIQMYESRNCVVHTTQEKKVVIIGLDGYIVAENDDHLLICKLEDEQRIKELADK